MQFIKRDLSTRQTYHKELCVSKKKIRGGRERESKLRHEKISLLLSESWMEFASSIKSWANTSVQKVGREQKQFMNQPIQQSIHLKQKNDKT